MRTPSWNLGYVTERMDKTAINGRGNEILAIILRISTLELYMSTIIFQLYILHILIDFVFHNEAKSLKRLEFDIFVTGFLPVSC